MIKDYMGVSDLNRLKANFNKVLDWLKFKEKPNAPLDVPAFVNKPIQSISEDLVGFDTHINAIKSAINSGANTIGIISDYGAGKSSLTELLTLDDENYCKPIKVNLWDSLCDTAECVSDSKAILQVQSNNRVHYIPVRSFK